jgi:uncharacterized Rmd1/YagE family protein
VSRSFVLFFFLSGNDLPWSWNRAVFRHHTASAERRIRTEQKKGWAGTPCNPDERQTGKEEGELGSGLSRFLFGIGAKESLTNNSKDEGSKHYFFFDDNDDDDDDTETTNDDSKRSPAPTTQPPGSPTVLTRQSIGTATASSIIITAVRQATATTTPLAMADAGDSETTPLMATSSASQPPPPQSPVGARPRAPRSVTFNANPVSDTFEADPRYVPAPARRHPYSINTATATGGGGGHGPFSAGAPVLSSLNSKLRRRNSHGAGMPMPGAAGIYGGPGGPGGIAGGGVLPHAFHGGGYPGGVGPKVGPQRSTKNAQKLKLLPNPDPVGDDGEAELEGDGDGEPRDVYSQYTRIKDPSARRDAARLGKADRQRLPRVTAYCTANKYQMDGLMRFLKGRGKTRGASPKLIDECIYTPYNYDFGGVANGWGGGHAVHEARESVQEVQEVQEPAEVQPSSSPSPLPAGADNQHPRIPSDDSGYGEGGLSQRPDYDRPETPEDVAKYHHGTLAAYALDGAVTGSPLSPPSAHSHHHHHHHPETYPGDLAVAVPAAPPSAAVDQTLDTHVHTPEVFLFDYGVVVIWGMSEAHEAKFLKELEKFEVEKLAIDDLQTELFNYYYTREYQPRIYNDFITLRDRKNYRTKLAISHGLAQSVKVSGGTRFFTL